MPSSKYYVSPETLLRLDLFVMNFTCNNTYIEVMDHFTGEIYTKFNTDDITEDDPIFGGGRFYVEFVRPLANGHLLIEVIDPYEVFKPENDCTKW